MNNTQIEFIFSAFGNTFSPTLFSDTVNLSPSHTWMKGDKASFGTSTFKKENYWGFSISKKGEMDLNVIINEFLEIFDEKSVKIKGFLSKCNAECKIDVIIKLDKKIYPSIYFNNKFINFIYEINASIDVDLY